MDGFFIFMGLWMLHIPLEAIAKTYARNSGVDLTMTWWGASVKEGEEDD
jgi:hypothetical protein